MKLQRGPVPIDLARELVDEALTVAAARASSKLRAAFRNEREAIQSIETVDIREKRLDALDSRWVQRLDVAESLEIVLARHPGVEDLVSACFLRFARAKEDEKAFLFDGDGAVPGGGHPKPSLVVDLTAETMLDREQLAPLIGRALAKARR